MFRRFIKSRFFPVAMMAFNLSASILIATVIKKQISSVTYSDILLTLLSFAVLSIFTMQLHYIARGDSIDEKFKKLEKKITDASGVYFLGTVDNSMDLILDKFKKAKEVKNTNISAIEKPSAMTDYRIRRHDEIVKSIVDVVHRDRSWHEVYSGPEGEKRASEVRSKIKKNNNKFYAQGYKQGLAIINFVIITYEDNSTEVLFGFGLHGNDAKDIVYGANDSLLVSYFHSYFSALAANSA